MRLCSLIPLLFVSTSLAQDNPKVQSAAELLEQLRAAGVELPEGFVANEDGSVSMPAQEGEATADAPVEGAPDGDGATPTDGEAAIDADTPIEPPKPEWDTKLNMGLSLATGNTENLGFASNIVSTRKTEATELLLDASYFYASEDGDKTENLFTSGFQNDWLFKNSKWLIFVDGRFDFDDFKSWEYRISSHVGPGYRLKDSEKFKVTLRAGMGAAREFNSPRDDIIPEALLGVDFDWKITENQSFEVRHRFYPDLDETGEYRMLTTAGWSLDLDRHDGLSFTVNLRHEYQSDVAPGIDENDLKLFAGLAYDF